MQSLQRLDEPYNGLYRAKDLEEEIEEYKSIGSDFNEQWGWYVVLDMLSNNNPTKWNEISEWNVLEFLNIISYYHAKAKNNEGK